MIKEVVRERDLHARPTFEYRYTEGEDLLDFDLQLRPYYVELVFTSPLFSLNVFANSALYQIIIVISPNYLILNSPTHIQVG